MKDTDYIEFVLERDEIKSYEDLHKVLGVSSSKIWRTCSMVLSESEKREIKEKLEQKNLQVNKDFPNSGEILKAIFLMRRKNKAKTKAIGLNKFDEIQDPRILKILEKYPESTIELMEDRFEYEEKKEFVSFVLTFEQFRREFPQYKPKERKEVIKNLFRETKVFSIDEFVLFVNDSNIVQEEKDLLRILGKNYFRTLKFNLKKFFPTYNKSKPVEASNAENGKESAEAVVASKTEETTEEEPKPAKVAETPKAEEEPKSAKVAETSKAEEELKPAKVVEAPKTEETTKAVESASQKKKKSFSNRKFKILDDSIYEWSSGIELAKDATVVAVDTNLLVSKKYRDNITNRFRKIGISSMVMKELRNLAEHKEEARIGINTIANSILNNKGVTRFFPIPDMKVLGRISADLDGDVEIIQAITESSEDAVTFVTADAGAAVYAWSVGCPCRFLKTDLKNTMQKDISCMSDGTAFLDNVYIKNIAQRLGSFSSIVISSEYAKMLNQKKLNHEDIRNFQMAIATDTRRVFIPAKLKSDSRCNRMAYESEVIRLCLEKDYTLVSNNKDFLAYAWSFGVKVSLI